MRVANLELDQIRPNPDQPRKDFRQDALQELADSIEAQDLLQPIVVRDLGDHFQIVAGERRFRAVTMLAWETVPSVIVELDDDATLVAATAENVNRSEMTVVEEANAYQRILDQGRTVEQVAALFGKGADTVQYRVDLLRLDETILDMVGKGHLSKDSGWYLSRLTVAGQVAVWRKFNNGEYADEAELRRGAQAQHKLDSEPSMFVLEDDVVVEKRREVTSLVEKQLANVKRSHDALDKILDLSDEDLVVGLGQGLDDLRAQLRALEAHARTVRNRVERAEALRIQSGS